MRSINRNGGSRKFRHYSIMSIQDAIPATFDLRVNNPKKLLKFLFAVKTYLDFSCWEDC